VVLAGALPERDLLVFGICFSSGSSDEIEVEDEVERGFFLFFKDLAKMFAPHFGVASLFLRKEFRPLAERAAGLGSLAEFAEPDIVGFHSGVMGGR
jgi:hypothetical protein